MGCSRFTGLRRGYPASGIQGGALGRQRLELKLERGYAVRSEYSIGALCESYVARRPKSSMGVHADNAASMRCGPRGLRFELDATVRA